MNNPDIAHIEKKHFQDQLYQLVNVAETFLKYSEEISIYYNEKKSQYSLDHFKKTKLMYILVLQQKLYFQETILIICSLFEKPNKKQEISFESYNQFNNNLSFSKSIEKLSKEFINSAFFTFRDKLLAHKDKSQEIDQIASYISQINSSYLKEMQYFIDKIKITLRRYWVNKSPVNIFSGFYDPFFHHFMKLVDQDILMELKNLKDNL